MKVSWDYDIPNIWKGIKFMFQTTNQLPVYSYYYNIDTWSYYASFFGASPGPVRSIHIQQVHVISFTATYSTLW